MAAACPAGHRGFTHARDHLVHIDKQDKLILARLQTPTLPGATRVGDAATKSRLLSS